MDEEYKVPIDYPRSTNDEKLSLIITDLSELLVLTKYPLATEKFSALLQLGLSELHHRRNAKDNKLTRELNEENNKFFKRATILSVVVSLVATICSFISIYFSYQNENDNKIWQTSQQTHLISVKRSLDSANFHLSKLTLSTERKISELYKKVDSLNMELRRVSIKNHMTKKINQNR
ncbi:MAG: hypothetical protein IM627_11100 [Cytophagales bacterium]|nr:hypothetical protein [Cytophagales bacterium]